MFGKSYNITEKMVRWNPELPHCVMWPATFHGAHSVTHQQPINIITIIKITIIIIISPFTPCYKKSILGSKQPVCGICFVGPDCPNICRSLWIFGSIVVKYTLFDMPWPKLERAQTKLAINYYSDQKFSLSLGELWPKNIFHRRAVSSPVYFSCSRGCATKVFNFVWGGIK